MKNIFLKLSLVGLFAFGLTSCEEETGAILDPNNGTNLYSFNAASSNLAVTEDIATDTIEIGVTSISNVDRTIAINIDPSSDATTAQYSVPSSVVIPAGKFIGKLVIRGNYDAIPEGEVKSTLVFTLDDSLQILDGKNFHVVSIYRPCAYENLDGTHTFVQHDVLTGSGTPGSGTPTGGEITGTVTFRATDVIGEFLVSDSSFGMYLEVYGDPVAPNATNPAGFAWRCSGGTAYGQTQYAEDLTYEVLAINGPVMTLQWDSSYGDGGTVEITREGGADWPVELVAQ